MSIQTSTVVSDVDHGRRRIITVSHVDHAGNETVRRILTFDKDTAAQDFISDSTAKADLITIEEEKSRIHQLVFADINLDSLSSDVLTNDQIAFEVARAASERPAEEVVNAAEWLSALTDDDLQRIFPNIDPVSGLDYWIAVKTHRDNVLAAKDSVLLPMKAMRRKTL